MAKIFLLLHFWNQTTIISNILTFNAKGEIVAKADRHYTDRNQYETDRYKRIAIEAVYDYSAKDNRHNKHDLTSSEMATLKSICVSIESGSPFASCKQLVIKLMETIRKNNPLIIIGKRMTISTIIILFFIIISRPNSVVRIVLRLVPFPYLQNLAILKTHILHMLYAP